MFSEIEQAIKEKISECIEHGLQLKVDITKDEYLRISLFFGDNEIAEECILIDDILNKKVTM